MFQVQLKSTLSSNQKYEALMLFVQTGSFGTNLLMTPHDLEMMVQAVASGKLARSTIRKFLTPARSQSNVPRRGRSIKSLKGKSRNGQHGD